MGDILFLAHRVPFPPDRGDKIRGFHIVNYLSERRRVHVIAFADDERDMMHSTGLDHDGAGSAVIWRSKPQWIAGVQALVRRQPVSLTAFESRPMREAVANILAEQSIDTIYVFSGQMAQYLPRLSQQRVIMDFVDVDSAKFEAYAAETIGMHRWLMRREAALLGQFERHVAARADANILVSQAEADLFVERTGAALVFAVENGIDTVFFDPAARFERIESMEDLIVFTGQMDYRPNVEAAMWFVDAILPHIRASRPQARFAIVGRRPTDAVKALAKRPGVMVTGEVADVRGWLAAASVVVAPLKLARGIQNKVLEAMAMGRPVVATAAAAHGIDHAATIRVGENAHEIADAVVDLLADHDVATALGAAARARVMGRYSWAACLAPLDRIIELGDRATPAQRTAA